MKTVFATLGLFIVDEFEYKDAEGNPLRESVSQIGGGGTYAAIGARIWLDQNQVCMIVDRGSDWPTDIQRTLDRYGSHMWHFRDHPGPTTRALNSYTGDLRSFEYLTPRIRLTPHDLVGVRNPPDSLHFICSPTRAADILSHIHLLMADKPITTIYEPIPDRCVPEELPALVRVLADITILSPNADEALSLLSQPSEKPERVSIEAAAHTLLGYGPPGLSVIIRSGPLGAYCLSSSSSQPHLSQGKWVDAFWGRDEAKVNVVDVTGAGNGFLGGLAAGLHLCQGDIYQAALYASISASFIVQQPGLPQWDGGSRWNGDDPQERLRQLQSRVVV